MKITFEPGDIIYLDDDADIPGELANETVKLIEKVKEGFWKVKSMGYEHSESEGQTEIIEEGYFNIKTF